MTREELQKYCKYYKGEEECPFEHDSPKGRYWFFEKAYLQYFDFKGVSSWEDRAKAFMEKHPNENTILNRKDIGIHTKGIIMFMIAMYSKWVTDSLHEVESYC